MNKLFNKLFLRQALIFLAVILVSFAALIVLAEKSNHQGLSMKALVGGMLGSISF